MLDAHLATIATEGKYYVNMANAHSLSLSPYLLVLLLLLLDTEPETDLCVVKGFLER